MIRMFSAPWHVLAALLLAGSAPARSPLPAQGTNGGTLALPTGAMAVPFQVGERLEYDVKFGSLKVGNGSMEVRELTEVRGHPAWHTVFQIKGAFHSTV